MNYVTSTSTDSRFYVQVNNFRFARNPPAIDVLETTELFQTAVD